MAVLKSFKAYRPKPEFAGLIAAKPYDVLDSNEAREEVAGNHLSFLHVGKPEIDLDPNINIYNPAVYAKGKENLNKLINDGYLVEDENPYLYIYSQTMNERTQYGIVGCASVDDYLNDVIKKHEHTRKAKEEDRCEHVRITNAHTGPIFLTYRDNPELNNIIAQFTSSEPENYHIASDGVIHKTWVIKDNSTIKQIENIFKSIPNLYVADGHHRSAAAAIVGKERREANPNHTGNEEYNFFLAVCFAASDLHIMDYNRVVKDLNGLSKEKFLSKIAENFTYGEAEEPLEPSEKGEFGMYIDGAWYVLNADEELSQTDDLVKNLDVSILQDYLLNPILGIQDPRTDNRIDFIGGIRGLQEIERRVDSGEMAVGFSLFPTSINDLMAIADTGNVMPPKSTWFEPKLRDGLFIHFLD